MDALFSFQAGKGHVEGASQSVTKTIDEVVDIVLGLPLEEAGELRTVLREQIETALIDLATKWYKIGFKRGHKVTFERHAKNAIFPTSISRNMKCKFLPNTEQSVKLHSNLSPKYRKSIAD